MEVFPSADQQKCSNILIKKRKEKYMWMKDQGVPNQP